MKLSDTQRTVKITVALISSTISALRGFFMINEHSFKYKNISLLSSPSSFIHMTYFPHIFQRLNSLIQFMIICAFPIYTILNTNNSLYTEKTFNGLIIFQQSPTQSFFTHHFQVFSTKLLNSHV